MVRWWLFGQGCRRRLVVILSESMAERSSSQRPELPAIYHGAWHPYVSATSRRNYWLWTSPPPDDKEPQATAPSGASIEAKVESRGKEAEGEARRRCTPFSAPTSRPRRWRVTSALGGMQPSTPQVKAMPALTARLQLARQVILGSFLGSRWLRHVADVSNAHIRGDPLMQSRYDN